MDDIPLIGCNNNLVVLIQNTQPEPTSYSFIYSLVKTTSINISATPNAHPIPFQTVATDHVQRNVDSITITGVIGCYGCAGLRAADTSRVISELKKLSESNYYRKENYLTLTSNDWVAENMILTSAVIDENQDSVMIKNITTTWVAANIVGSVTTPYFGRGGIKYTN